MERIWNLTELWKRYELQMEHAGTPIGRNEAQMRRHAMRMKCHGMHMKRHGTRVVHYETLETSARW